MTVIRATARRTSAAAALLLALTACSVAPPEQAVSAPMPDEQSVTAPQPRAMQPDRPAATTIPTGSYVTYADYAAHPDRYAAGDVVLFFNATWCPTCQEAAEHLGATSFPKGLTVVSVDYDSSEELRRTYGVTTQHTFVQIDPDGEELARFTGSTTVDDIAGRLA